VAADALRDHDCLHLVAVDTEVILEREPVLYDNWETIFTVGDARPRDVRYLDSQGKKVSLLVAKPCDPPEPEPETRDPAATEPATPEAAADPASPDSAQTKPAKTKSTKNKSTKTKSTKTKSTKAESAQVEKTP
jgi:hypothetical protein